MWAMAQAFLGLTRSQVAELAAAVDVKPLERPISGSGAIWGEMYSQPHTIFVQYDDAGIVHRVAVEDIWPNYWWPGWQDTDDSQ